MLRIAWICLVGCCLAFLCIGCGNKNVALKTAVTSGDNASVQELLRDSSELANEKCDNGETLLHIAAAHDKRATANVLIDAGADVNAKDSTGQTPLNVALNKGAKGWEMAKILIERGAEIKIAIAADPKCRVGAEHVEKMIAEARAAAEAREERIAREREERVRIERARAEAESIWNSLDVAQGIGTYTYSTGNTSAIAAPGDSIAFGVQVKNNGDSPISGITCVMERNKYIDAGDCDERVPLLRVMYKRRLKQWQTSGIPVCRYSYKLNGPMSVVDLVNPKNDPHYEENTKSAIAGTDRVPYTRAEDAACEKAEEAAGIIFTSTPGNSQGLGSLPLKLSESSPAGTDLEVKLYIVIRGHRFPLQPMTIQVKHTE